MSDGAWWGLDSDEFDHDHGSPVDLGRGADHFGDRPGYDLTGLVFSPLDEFGAGLDGGEAQIDPIAFPDDQGSPGPGDDTAPAPDEPKVIGDPAGDRRHWHKQRDPYSCAVAAQEDVMEAATGRSVAEAQLAAEAVAHGWYDPTSGTPVTHLGDLLDAHGIPTVRGDSATMADLVTLAGHDVPVLVVVDSSQLWAAGAGLGAALADAPVIVGGGADHVVVVTGFDVSDPAHPAVVLNDSGRPDGAALRVDLDRFEDAWAQSDHYLVYPAGESTTPPRAPEDDDDTFADCLLVTHGGAHTGEAR